jgi:hypothetical protein
MPIRRRSYQISLGTLLRALTAFTFLVWLGWNVKEVRDRASVRPHLLGSQALDRSDAVVVRLSDTQSKVFGGGGRHYPVAGGFNGPRRDYSHGDGETQKALVVRQTIQAVRFKATIAVDAISALAQPEATAALATNLFRKRHDRRVELGHER